MALPSGEAALHWVEPVSGPAVGVESEAEARCAVADLKQTVGE